MLRINNHLGIESQMSGVSAPVTQSFVVPLLTKSAYATGVQSRDVLTHEARAFNFSLWVGSEMKPTAVSDEAVLYQDYPYLETHLDGYRQHVQYENNIAAEDIRELEIQQETFAYLPSGISNYMTSVERLLHAMHVRVANINVIKSPNGEIARGSTRIPLKVTTERGVFVVKAYDEYDPDLERRVLAAVSGKVAPKIIHFGDELYAEEFVSGNSLLHSVFGKNNSTREMQDMVETCAVIYAELAQLGVHYHHCHCVDEFRIGKNGKILVTDFGTSHFFYDDTWFSEQGVATIDAKIITALNERDLISFDHDFEKYCDKQLECAGYLNERSTRLKLQGLMKQVSDGKVGEFFNVSGDEQEFLNQLDGIVLVNLMCAVEDMERALKNFFEKHQWGKFQSGWDSLRPFQPRLRQKFMQHYLRINSLADDHIKLATRFANSEPVLISLEG